MVLYHKQGMIRSLLKNATIYTLGAIITRGLLILLLPIYTRYLSPKDVGIIDLFAVIGSIINIIITLEITQAVARYYPEGKNEQEKSLYTSTAFWFTVSVYILYLIISISFSEYFTVLLLDSIDYEVIFILAIFSVATNGIFYFTQNQLKWQIQPKDNFIASLINTLVLALVSIILLVFGLKVESIFIGQILGNVISSFISIYLAKGSYRPKFSINKLYEMISFSFPLVFSGIAVFIATYIDRVAIKDLLGLEDLGIYGVAYRFASVAGIIMIGFQNSLMPLVFKHYKEQNTPKYISDIFNLFAILALFVISISILFSKEIVFLFTTEAFYRSYSLIGILVMANFFSNMYIFAPGIWIAKKTKLVVLITVISAILNTVLNYTLIPIAGVIGAAYATLISAILAFLLFTIFGHRYYHIPYKTKKLLFSFILTLVSAYGILKILNQINLISAIIKLIYIFLIIIVISSLLIERKHLEKIKLIKGISS
jgi:O-antigen/teichoic acid export membrane protein